MTLTRFGVGDNVYTFTGRTDLYPQTYSDNFQKTLSGVQRVPGIDGGRLQHGVTRSREIGKVNASFVLVARTRDDMDAKRRDLRAIAGFNRTRLYRTHNSVEQWCNARVNNVDYDIDLAGHDDLQQRVQVSWQVSDPFWYGIGTEAWRWDDGTEWDTQPWGGIDEGSAYVFEGTLTEFTVNVSGNRYTVPRFVFVPGSTPTDFRAINDATVERIENGVVVDSISGLTAVSALGMTILVNARTRQAVRTYAAAPDEIIQPPTLRKRWFILKPGTNTIRVTSPSEFTSGRLFIYYYTRYV